MDTKNSKINKAVSAEIRAERGASGMTIEDLAATSGLSLSTLKRILKPDVDIAMADLAAIAAAFTQKTGEPVTPADLMERATKRAGGYETL